MRILVTNDDGIFAPGLASLVQAFSSAGHEIIVSAPDTQRSAAGHSIVLNSPISVKQETVPYACKAYAIGGTPADCVRIALRVLVPQVGFVLSGINHGYNAGTDVLYSGTVAAAMEAALTGLPAMAVSLGKESNDYERAASEALRVFRMIGESWPGSGKMLNLNIPEHFNGTDVKTVPLCRIRYKDTYAFRERIDWKAYYIASGWIDEAQPLGNDDFGWLAKGYPTVTVLSYDMADSAETQRIGKLLHGEE